MESNSSTFKKVIKILLTVVLCILTPYVLIAALLLGAFGAPQWAILLCFFPFTIPAIWFKRRKPYLITYVCLFSAVLICCGVQWGIAEYERSITIDVAPNIDVNEYLPFDENSKIVKMDSKTLKFTEDDELPRIDGASAAFPVYSAFVNAVYPNTEETELYNGVFEYNNTRGGYQKLARKEIDIFIGAGPSKEQKAYAEEQGTEFVYTQIGWEAFVFFVHKDNPINSLTVEQIKGIYSGKITNWREVGGSDEEIIPFQRDEGSGSQSMMLRFMGDTPLMEAETKTIQGMGAVIEEVVDYQSRAGSIGYSFRYYIEGIVQNPEVKMIAVEGVAPTADNVRNNTYPIITPVYAVTYANNPNPNVARLVEWILSEEGQYIIEQTGYVGMKKDD
jgi:phosphate transport system substrate-binding protein